ncbi:hypothetical protein HGRIS_008504 [Hohenbuehelia grisea]|uniref:Dopey N-terminal domain-containing protein n=1 Tax=Hohenbuehelia grisea TaxID=104357 RepID=A0ABR3J860_9AGAR
MSSKNAGNEALGAASAKKDSVWASTRKSEREAAQQAFASDPKYKKYVQQVEKCLNSFDNVHEWADCIAFLKQLLKTFQSYMQFKEIPRKLIVAKRLSQCLNPALPTGVHQRALDVYAHILAVLGSEGLKRDLPVWSSGLFPFFEYAATSVKPTLLNLYDTHYLPLQAGLRPIMKSFILALLPGLEEETGEFFEKVLGLLDKLSGTVSPSFFFQNIWLIMLTTPSARGTAINFLGRRLPRLNANEDITAIIGRDIGLMIRAFAAALEDDNLLVRRGALDILLQSLRVDSVAIQRAQAEDRTILMRAATGVVLRRDLSLNRRLYTWLLGTDEKSENQVAYLKEHALELLRATLKDEMFAPSSDYSESRPFKIFISLLDKWEIGAALTEVLVYDAFKAIKSLVEAGDASSEEVKMTASTLYEALEPLIIWKQLLSCLFTELLGDGTRYEAIRIVSFIIRTFSQDEEIQAIHLPAIFCAILDVMNVQLQTHSSKATSATLKEALYLAEGILRQIPHVALMKRPELTKAEASSQRSYLFACTFYDLPPSSDVPESTTPVPIPFASAFENLVSLSMVHAQMLINDAADRSQLRDVFSQVLLLIDRLVGRLGTTLSVAWDPTKWLNILLASLEHESANFVIIDRTIALLVALHQTKGLEPRLSIDSRPIMYKMVNKLLLYLHGNFSAYHVRAVNLLWAIEASTKRPHVEAIVAQTMTSPEFRNTQDAYEAFGVLWRLTDENMLPGFRFKVPLMIVLDTLKSDDPGIRRIGETWMRCSLKSYVRVLDPIIFDLLDPNIRRVPTLHKVRGKEIQGFQYERAFDERYIGHILEVLLSVVRFGGQGITKTARLTPVQRSHNPDLVKRVETGMTTSHEATYLDILLDLLLCFLQSEPKPELSVTMSPLNSAIQSTCVDILQMIITRGEVDLLNVEILEAAVISKLYFCIHSGRLDIQNKLLHLLHSLFSASMHAGDHSMRSTISRTRSTDGAEDPVQSEAPPEAATRPYPVNPLLMLMLSEGISTPSNRPILQHWLDFLLTAVPHFQPILQALVTPLNECLCQQLLVCLEDIQNAASVGQHAVEDIQSTATDAELIMLLNGLERLVLLSLAYTAEPSSSDEPDIVSEKSEPETTGLLGYVSTVFSSDNSKAADEQLTARSPAYRSLHEGVRVLYLIWVGLAWHNPQVWSPRDDSLSLIFNRSRMRCRKVLEHFFRVHGAEVFESVIECWSRQSEESKGQQNSAFELIDVLLASAQTSVHMICESISCRISGISEKAKKQAINPNLTDGVLFQFLEQYLQRLEGPLAVQVWNRFLQLAKELMAGAREFRLQTYPTLRCLIVLADKITQTTAIDDRRMRKEIQDTFLRLLDTCVIWIGRSVDQGSWIRRTTREALGAASGRESPVPRDAKLLDDKTDAGSPSLPESPRPPQFSPNSELILRMNVYLAEEILPHIRKLLPENDKILAACTNIVYYIVGPSMKGKTRPMDIDTTILNILREMSRIPAALKAWRAPVTELLNDNRLFNCSPETAEKWQPIIKALFDADKSAFPELLAKVTTAPSANIFTNREYEMLLQSLSIRRLSFVLYSGEKNHFLTSLPTIQEKLVDILRTGSAPNVQSEVYLCIRVLLCRLSPHNLTSFWPVVLTELYRIFEQVMTSLPPDGSEDLQLVLAASKCLDLLIALQTEEFQIHQWIFITDTVDAIYRPDEYFPEAMMDQLADLAGSLPLSNSHESYTQRNGVLDAEVPASATAEQRPIRRPLLGGIRQIDSIRDLVPFFSSVSITSFENVYHSSGMVDWIAVERSLIDDMFDSRPS